MRILRLSFLFCLFLLPACMSEAQKTRLEQQSSIPLSCLPGADCDAKWRRARHWIEDNSHFPILKANEKEIVVDSSEATFSPVVSVKMTTNSQDSDENSIVFTAECQNVIGCNPTELQTKAAFTAYVNDTVSVPDVDNDADLGVTFAPGDGRSNAVVIETVVPGSPAANAGWRPGDRLVKYNGHAVTSGAQVAGMVTDTPPGSVFPVQIARGGKTIVAFMQL